MKNSVAVIVLSYNSAETIQSTLDSISKLDYDKSNVEVIIQDDASSDNSYEIATNWKEQHLDLFNNITCVKNVVNIGTSKNLNKAFELVNSLWVKPVAADDLLLDNCLKLFMKHITVNKLTEGCFFSNLLFFGDRTGLRSVNRNFFNLPAVEQYRYIIKHGNCLPAPTTFISMQTYRVIGGFSEDIRNVEDYPTWLKLMALGYKADFIDGKPTVMYRISDSVSRSRKYIFSEMLEEEYSFYKLKVRPSLFNVSPMLTFSKDLDYKIKCFFFNYFNDRKYIFAYKILRNVNLFKVYFYINSKFRTI